MLLRFRWFAIAFSMVLALAPLSGVIAAAVMASALGCEINDAATTQSACVAHGRDLSPILSGLMLTAGLGQIVYLILAIVLIAWGLAEGCALLVRWWRRERPAR